MLRRPGFLCALLLVLLLHAAPAYGAAGDPEAGSPSEGVYEVPLDAAREDAAPGSGGTTAPAPGGSGGGSGGESPGEASGGGTGEATEPSNYRSENNFGSSSQVPGAAKAGAGAGRASTGSAGGGAAGDGGGTAGRGLDAEPLSAPASDTGNTSVAGNLALLAAIGVLAAVLGVVLNRRRVRTR